MEKRYYRWAYFCLFLFCCIYFWNIHKPGLITPGEPRYAEISLNMVQSGNWIIPEFNGQIHLEKPPLLYWLTALSYKMFGASEISSRIIPIIAGLMTGFFIYQMTLQIYGRPYAILASIILLSSFGWSIFSRFLLTDILSTFLQVGCLYFYWNAEKTNKIYYYFFFFVFLSLGVLTRALLFLVFPIFIIAIDLCFKKDWSILKNKKWVFGFIIFFLITSIWHILVEFDQNGFLNHYLLHNHIGRFLGSYPPGGNESLSLFQFWAIFCGGYFPWSFMIPFFCIYVFNRFQGEEKFSSSERFLFIWTTFIILFLSLSSARLERYYLPLLPPLSILISGLFRPQWIKKWWLRFFLIGLFIIAIALLITSLFFWGIIPKYEYVKFCIPWIILCLAGGAFISYLSIKKSVYLSVLLLMFSFLGIHIMVYSSISKLDSDLSMKNRFDHQFLNQFDIIVVDKSYQHYEGLYFYYNRNVQIYRQTNHEVETLARWDGALHPHIDQAQLSNIWVSDNKVLFISKFNPNLDFFKQNISKIGTVYKKSPYTLLSNKTLEKGP